MVKKVALASKLRYDPQVFEEKWQKAWREENIFVTPDTSEKEKNYVLTEFPYPSGDLHMGHWYAFAPADVYARYKRMRGYNVLFPIGFDAFGLPAENAAIQRGIHPRDWTYGNIERMLKQFESMGPSFDWGRMIITCDPEYYRWNQWMFLKMYEAGLVYRDEVPANWCPKCQTVLANEQVEKGCCWRHSDTEVIQKKIPQWLFRTTAYADKLLWSPERSLRVDWPKSVVEGQNKWIGRSEGTEIKFQIPPASPSEAGRANSKFQIRVFTTRQDTIFGATFLALSPEHKLVSELLKSRKIDTDIKSKIQNYIDSSSKKTELERKGMKGKTGLSDEAPGAKSGVFTGTHVINPLTKEKIPVWIADYVLSGYGTGGVMGVPAHDERDFEFAKKYGLEIRQVIQASGVGDQSRNLESAYEGEGTLVDSGEFSGLKSEEAKKKITEYIEKNHLGERKIQYHLHDWTISRQRYWGTPIPIIHCKKCARLDPSGQGVVPVPEKDLPVELPYKVDYTPRGKAPLATAAEFVNTKCPKCNDPAKRDTDTMDTFVDSSWYFFRFASPHYNRGFADPELVKKWLPIDIYFGGAEHTLGHTMYARFFTKVLHDLGYISFDEFALKRVNHGVILGPDGQKMSKSRGNVVNPDGEVKKYGADTVRLYLCFMGPHEAGGPWDTSGVMGSYRFLRRVWELVVGSKDLVLETSRDSEEVLRAMHKAIKKVGADIEQLKFNTAISSLMIYLNTLQGIAKRPLRQSASEASKTPASPKTASRGGQNAKRKIRCAEWDEALRTLLLLLAPFAPHMTEELWQKFYARGPVGLHPRPTSSVGMLPAGARRGSPASATPRFKSIHLQPWLAYDSELAEEEIIEIPVQVNGRFRGTVQVDRSEAEKKDVIEAKAHELASLAKHIKGEKIKKVIFVPGRLINFVV